VQHDNEGGDHRGRGGYGISATSESKHCSLAHGTIPSLRAPPPPRCTYADCVCFVRVNHATREGRRGGPSEILGALKVDSVLTQPRQTLTIVRRIQHCTYPCSESLSDTVMVERKLLGASGASSYVRDKMNACLEFSAWSGLPADACLCFTGDRTIKISD
jgi:hypothetical protein